MSNATTTRDDFIDTEKKTIRLGPNIGFKNTIHTTTLTQTEMQGYLDEGYFLLQEDGEELFPGMADSIIFQYIQFDDGTLRVLFDDDTLGKTFILTLEEALLKDIELGTMAVLGGDVSDSCDELVLPISWTFDEVNGQPPTSVANGKEGDNILDARYVITRDREVCEVDEDDNKLVLTPVDEDTFVNVMEDVDGDKLQAFFEAHPPKAVSGDDDEEASQQDHAASIKDAGGN
ncbi:MAG: hypothetical protein GC129_05905 [Proteobacteria bacterium]|nr:hypothetical protein [Pseudomonadota bacterium]